MIKKITAITSIFFFLIIAMNYSQQNVLAQNQPINNSISSEAEIAKWATTITDSLHSLYCDEPIYNRQLDLIRNNGATAQRRQGSCTGTGLATYFCTNLVTDSYKLAGFKDVTNEIYVPYMIKDWGNTPEYEVLNENNIDAVKRLISGDVIFLETSDHKNNHVVVIKSIDIDSNGNGIIKIKQANGYGVDSKYAVSRWRVIVSFKSDTNTIIRFGLGPRI